MGWFRSGQGKSLTRKITLSDTSCAPKIACIASVSFMPNHFCPTLPYICPTKLFSDFGVTAAFARPSIVSRVGFTSSIRNCLQKPEPEDSRARTLGYFQKAGRWNLHMEGRRAKFGSCHLQDSPTRGYLTRRLHDLQPNHRKEKSHSPRCNVALPWRGLGRPCSVT
jgi:hypothetical protein